MIKDQFKPKYSTAIAMLIAASLAYYILLADNQIFSIDSIIDFSQEFELPTHVLVLGLIPIYISSILFGAVMFGLYLGRLFRSILTRF